MLVSNLLSPGHIQKLGHEIEEIRYRALGSVFSKYNLQLVDETNTENNKQLFVHLLKWFEFENHPDEAVVLKLIQRVTQCENFITIVGEIGADKILKQIGRIESKTDPSFLSVISEIKDRILTAKRKADNSFTSDLVVELAEEAHEIELKAGADSVSVQKTGVADNAANAPNESSHIRRPLNYLPWQALVTNDRQVLMAIYEGLRYIDNMPSIVESSQFFKDVVLRDFPPEIFLQRPLIFQTFLELLKSGRAENRLPVLRCLIDLTEYLNARIMNMTDPSFRGRCWKFEDQAVSGFSFEIEDAVALQKDQIRIFEFGENLMRQVTSREKGGVEEATLTVSLICNILRLFLLTDNDMRQILSIMQQAVTKPWSKMEGLTLITHVLNSVQDNGDMKPTFRQIIYKNSCIPSLVLFFPNLHYKIISVLAALDETGLLKDYEDCINICSAMEAADDCIKLKNNFSSKLEYFRRFDQALLSLEYHKNLQMVKDFIKICLLRDVTDSERELRTKILLKLLCYPDEEICVAFYQEIHRNVKKCAGVGENSRGMTDKLEFLYEEAIWKELLCFSINSTPQVTELYQESIILILKSKPMTSDTVWCKLCESLLPSLDLLSIYADNASPFGRCISRFFDPDIASSFALPFGEVLRGNLRLLFNKDVAVNEMAFARLCWILDNAPDSAEKHLKTAYIKGLGLSTICTGVCPRRENIAYTSISSPRSLEEALAVLRNMNSEPRTRKFALARLDVIMKDISLHRLFLDEGGLELLISATESALTESDESYPADSVISIVAILAILTKRDPIVRMELAAKDDILLNVIRCLLLFNGDEKFREDAVELLFLLLYSNQIKRVNLEQPLRCQLSITYAILQKIHVPVALQAHGKVSLNVIASRKVLIMGNAHLSCLLRVYWAALCLGNICKVLPLEDSDLQQDIFSLGLPGYLRLTPADLKDLQSSSLVHVMRSLLISIQKATSHDDVLDCIHNLNGCLTWLETYQTLPVVQSPPYRIVTRHNEDLHCLPWISTFERFLTVPPACMEDEALLHQLLGLANRLLKIMQSQELVDWITSLLTRPASVLSKLLKQIGDSGYGIEGRELRRTVTELAHRVLFTSMPSAPWLDVLKHISEYFEKTSGGQQGSVAPIDWILGLLADITALTWDFSGLVELYENLIKEVMEILMMFNGFTEPKGSFLCTNIVGNALISLANLLSDGARTIKNYENIWESALSKLCEEGSDDVDFNWILSLTTHGDPQVRSSSLCLISGFFGSNVSYEVLVGKLSLEVGIVWGCALTILFDNQECAVVREKAADLLARMTGLGSENICADFTYLTTDNFFETLASAISCLDFEEHKSLTAADVTTSVTTPALVTAICKLLLAVCLLNPAKGSQQIAESGLLQTLLRSLSVVDDLDVEKLEMVIAGTKLVRTCTSYSSEAKNIVNNSPECYRATFFYLNPKLCEIWPLPLIDSLWTEVLSLLSTILVKTDDGHAIFQKALYSSHSIEENFLITLVQGLQSSDALKTASRSLFANIACRELSNVLAVEVLPGESLAINACSILMGNLQASTDALANLFIVSKQAQSYALSHGLAETTLLEVKKIVLKLRAENVDNLRKITGKKKIDPLLKSLQDFYRLTMHFCHQNPHVKARLADCGLADTVNRVWLWYGHRPVLLTVVLKMLCSFTEKSERACQSLALTSSPAGLRKSPGAVTLIHSLIQLVSTEVDQYSRSKGFLSLGLGLEILSNSCEALECRVVLAKGAILTPLSKIVASLTKRRQYGEDVLELWLEFLASFTVHSEGQTAVCQSADAMEFIYTTAASTTPFHRKLSLTALNQIATNPLNRVRLLATPANLLAVILLLLQTQPAEDVKLASAVLWSLSANSQKGKLILRSAGCVAALREARQRCTEEECLEVLDRTIEVLNNK